MTQFSLFPASAGTQHRHLVERHEIDAYPSILLYADGDIYHPMQYVGLRDPDKMVEWVSAEIGKLESAAEPVSNYYAGSNRARYVCVCAAYACSRACVGVASCHFPGFCRCASKKSRGSFFVDECLRCSYSIDYLACFISGPSSTTPWSSSALLHCQNTHCGKGIRYKHIPYCAKLIKPASHALCGAFF